jgi:hypothetical protein
MCFITQKQVYYVLLPKVLRRCTFSSVFPAKMTEEFHISPLRATCCLQIILFNILLPEGFKLYTAVYVSLLSVISSYIRKSSLAFCDATRTRPQQNMTIASFHIFPKSHATWKMSLKKLKQYCYAIHTLKMKALSFSETLVSTYQLTRRHIPYELNLNIAVRS